MAGVSSAYEGNSSTLEDALVSDFRTYDSVNLSLIPQRITAQSGAAIVEQIFGLPGLGYTLIQAITTRDYPVIQATTMVIATVFVVMNLVVDLLYTVLDPRISVD